ncbi:MAG: alpha/beta hydrolase [Actinobacteria bacterium]|nr:alpha/beta hydrolase [Actinomycetota bacterium]
MSTRRPALVVAVAVVLLAACRPTTAGDTASDSSATTETRETRETVETIAYGPGPDQVLDLHLPDGDDVVPVVVLLHGGFWRDIYVRDLTDPLARALAERGYAAVNLEYGRVGGTGGWPRTFEDVAAGIDHLGELDHPRLDLARVAVIGHSAGGLLATWTAVRAGLPDDAPGADPAVVPVAVVSLAGVNELTRAAEEGLGAGAPQDLLGGRPAEVPDRYRVADPAQRLPLDVPWLGVHAETDDSVPLDMTIGFAARLEAAGGDATVEIVAGDHMSVIEPGAGSFAVVLDWLSARLDP